MAEPLARAPAQPAVPAPLAAGYGWFVAGAGSWFAAWGMQSVLFSWLVVGDLQAGAEQVGTAQMALMLPGLLLVLVGGATADRRDRRRLLMGLHVTGAALAAALAAAVAAGRLSFAVLIAYALCMGALAAFVLPARDSLLSEVAGHDMMRAVTGLTMTQFGMQAAGALLGGSARWVGSASALCLQGTLILAGVLALSRLAPAPAPARSGPRGTTVAEIGEALREVWRSERLRPSVVLVMFNGLLFLGPFLVAFPLLIRDVYARGVGALGLVNMAFSVGTIAGSVALLRRRGIRRKGRALLLALFAGGLCLASVAWSPPFWGLLFVVFVWGVCGSVFFNAGRTLVQEAAPPTQRARVLSVYSLGLLGTAPLGALQAGFAAERLGPLAVCGLSGAAMLGVVALAWVGSGMRHMD